MSQLIASIKNIQSVESLNIVTFVCNGESLKMMSLDLSQNVQVGKRVILGCKPTSVALAKPSIHPQEFSKMLSYANQIKVNVDSIEVGELLSVVKVRFGDFILESIITTEALEKMKLQKNDELLALIKANELSIQEVLND